MIPIGVNAANLVLGPGRMYIAPFGSTEPLDSTVTPQGYLTPPGGAWTDVGGTDGGVTVEVDTTYTDLQVDQLIMNVGARLTELKLSVTTKLSELTAANIQSALNGIGVTGGGTGYSTLEVPVTSAASQPAYAAVIVDGWAPYTTGGTPALRRIIVRKVLNQVKLSLAYDKKTQQAIDCTFSAYFVSTAINPLHVVDELT